MTVNKVFNRVLFCDASNVGFRCFVNSDLGSHLENFDTFGKWTESESR